MSFTYILYSSAIDKYYVGATQTSLEERLENHNSHAYGKTHFTAQADDCKLVLSINAKDYSHAIRLERKIKSMKSRVYISNLIKYAELREKIYNETLGT